MDYALYIASFLVLLVMSTALFRRLTPIALSPITAIFLLYLVLFLLGPLIYNPAYGGGGMSFYTSTEDELKLIPKVFWILSGLSSGVLIFTMVSKKRNDLRAKARGIRQVRITSAVAGAIIVFAIFALVLQVEGVGAQNLWYRHVYLVFKIKIIKKIAGMLTLMSVPMLGLVSADVRLGRGVRRMGTMFFLIDWALYAALSTRLFALVPVLYMFGRFLADPENPRTMRGIIVAGLLAPLLVVYPMFARVSPNQGLAAIPENLLNMAGLGNRSTSVLSADNYHMVLNTMFIAVPQTESTFESGANDNWAYLRTAVNPLPGLYTDYEETEVDVGPHTPPTAIGALLRCGVWISVLYYAVVGYIFANLEANLRGGHGPGLVRLAQVGMAFLFVILSIQYPLRNTTRPVYYILFVEIGLFIYENLKLRRTVPDLNQAVLRQ